MRIYHHTHTHPTPGCQACKLNGVYINTITTKGITQGQREHADRLYLAENMTGLEALAAALLIDLCPKCGASDWAVAPPTGNDLCNACGAVVTVGSE